MILIEHAVVVTVDRERRILADGSVLVDGRNIVQVGPAGAVRPPRPPARIIDGRRRLVLPGFVDTHVHLSEHLNRGLLLDDIPVDRYLPDWLIPLYAAITPEEQQVSALLACVEMIRTGTTTFCEAGTLFDVSAVADAVETVGMRAVLGRWTWDLATGPGRMQQTTEEALRQNAAMLDAVRGRAAGRIQAWPLLLGFGTCSPALIQGAHALAERHGVGWGMMHFASHPSRRTADRVPLAELDALGALTPRTKLAHMVYVDDADIALLARRNVKISHCPTAGLKHIKGLAAHGRFVEMLDAGVCVSLGGDSGNGSNHFDMLRLMYLVATIYKDARLDVGVMPPERALEMATVRGAEALLLDGAIGSIEPGKRADLVLYDLDAPEWRPSSTRSTISSTPRPAPVSEPCSSTAAWSSTRGASPRWMSARSTTGPRSSRARRSSARGSASSRSGPWFAEAPWSTRRAAGSMRAISGARGPSAGGAGSPASRFRRPSTWWSAIRSGSADGSARSSTPGRRRPSSRTRAPPCESPRPRAPRGSIFAGPVC
jgi:5-methylthioadenosine/S-adenosylhomocysteine deaminase